MGISFACKKFEIEEVVKCSLALSKSDFIILKFLMKLDGDLSTEELSEKLGFEKSTVQRAVKKLHGKGLLFRSQKNQTRGGYLFFYRIKNKIELRKKILKIVGSWYERFETELKKW
jgi:predicted transcriptional regulator